VNIQVITDSTSYISGDVAEKLGIRIIPLSFTFGDEYIRETEIGNEDFYKLMEEKGSIPKSSQPPIQDFIDIFSEYVNKGKKVIGIFISNEMSGTYNTAKMAGNMVSENFKDCQIEIINSKRIAWKWDIRQ
jgi:DegV family protein with EDD domain